MIQVKRPPFPRELLIASNRIEREHQRLAEQVQAQIAQPQFSSEYWLRMKPALVELFRGKCAYCETPISGAPGQVDHFRPKLGAMGLDRKVDRYHYYWLAYTWTNLYLVCHDCNVNKKTLFPVQGERAGLRESVDNEKPLLIDPCVDNPVDHLFFKPDGSVRPLTERGEVTIKVIGLDRPTLVKAREQAAQETLQKLEELHASKQLDYVDKLVSPVMPYTAARLDCLTDWMGRNRNALNEVEKNDVDAATPTREVAIDNAGDVEAAAAQAVAAAPAINHGGFLKSIRLTNFRAIKQLDLTVHGASAETTPEPSAEATAGWVMLLGENAAGKSSILQALAVSFLGDEGLRELHLDLDRLINNDEDAATVVIETTAQPPVIELHLTRGGPPRFEKGGEGYPGLMLAYGATRVVGNHLLQKTKINEDDKRANNLFDPFAPLTPADPWLRELHARSPEAFDDAGQTLRDLLMIEEKQPLSIENGHVIVNTGRGRVTIDQLSSGFQSIFSLAIDIMQASAEQTQLKRYVSGIVLLDEIDAHLHPRWKMEVVGALRKAFPYIQFIVSTHEPLCLRGTKEGEIVLMRRREETNEVEAVTEGLPAPEKMRVDQLLTSPLFGLHMTIDPKVEKEFREYYALLAKDPRTEEEKKELETMKKKIRKYGGVLGYTRRDQIAYQIIDEYVAREPVIKPEDRPAEFAQMQREVLDLWESVPEAEG